ncbi:hypothetical protein CF319_g8847 [Tilletia indica]|nr:hypothetical protein CF319_g8847 [Tilletia indica]
MISISSSTAALCPQSFASMAPCTECTHHTTPTSIPFPTSMTYLHASSSRILTPTRAARYFPDDLEAHEAARFWAQTDEDIDVGYSRKVSDAEWVGEVGDLEDVDDDSRSDLGAPEMDENSWKAPPPAYEDAAKASSSTSSTRRLRRTCSDLSPEAGTLQLSVNARIVPPSPPSSTGTSSSSSSRSTTSSTRSAATTQITPTKPSLLSLAFLGSTRALARSRARAERKAAHLEELHDAWMKLGVNTRELLARGGEGALPPFFEHPPRCGLGEMMEGMRL